jgi:hypothetical protein
MRGPPKRAKHLPRVNAIDLLKRRAAAASGTLAENEVSKPASGVPDAPDVRNRTTGAKDVRALVQASGSLARIR